MSDIDRRGNYVLPAMRAAPAPVAAPLAGGAVVEFVDLPAVLAEVALLRARDRAWRGLAHAGSIAAAGAAVSGNRSGTIRP